MKRPALTSLMLLIAALAVPQDVDVDVDVEELESHIDREVVFTSYEGQHEFINTAAQIRAIGMALAASLADQTASAELRGRYSVTHAVGTEESEGLYADIVSFDNGARVDHIANVRRIVAGFLESAYDFSRADADMIAVFVTFYNAIYRGDMDYLSYNYKPIVLQHIDSQNAGLATHFGEWPGATKILIPLSHRAARGKLSSLQSTALTDDQVISQMRESEDRELDTRKDMVDFQERQVEEMSVEIQDEKRELEVARAAVEEERRQIEQERERLAAVQDQEAQEEGAQQPSPQVPQEDQETQAAQERELAQREQALQEQEEQLEAAEAEIAAVDEEIAHIEEQMDVEREQILVDEDVLDRQPTVALATEPTEPEQTPVGAAFLAEKVFYLRQRPDSAGQITSLLLSVDPITDTIEATSPLTHIVGKSYHFFNEQILVVAYTETTDSPAYLVLLDPRTLAPTLRSESEVYSQTVIRVYSESIYAVIKTDEEHRVARFDENLVLAGQSTDTVFADTVIEMSSDKLYVTDQEGQILVLDRADFTRKAAIPAASD